MKTGNTYSAHTYPSAAVMPQWSPVMKTGNTTFIGTWRDGVNVASMEPGHEDREYP